MAALDTLYLRLDPDLKDELVREARKAGRSVNEEAVGRLRRSLDGALAEPEGIPGSNPAGDRPKTRIVQPERAALPAADEPRGNEASAHAYSGSASASEPQEPEGRSLPASPPQSPGVSRPAASVVAASPRPARTEPGSDALAHLLARADVTTGDRVQAKPFSKTDQAGRKK